MFREVVSAVERSHIGQDRDRKTEGCGPAGFTLIELLVVIGIIGLLAALLLPTFAKAKVKSIRTQCLANTKQLQMAWQFYAHDFNDRIVPNPVDIKIIPPTPPPPLPAAFWVVEQNYLGWNNALPGALSFEHVQQGLLFRYASNLKLYACPDQRQIEAYNYFTRTGRVLDQRPARSYSISGQMSGPGLTWMLRGNPAGAPPAAAIWQIKGPQPAEAMVFVDESMFSIDDGAFIVQVTGNNWRNYPATRHENVGVFSFADGHSETHPWKESSTAYLSNPTGNSPAPLDQGGRNVDLQWCSDHYISPVTTPLLPVDTLLAH